MSKNTYDIFALVINFLDKNWQPKKVTISLFNRNNRSNFRSNFLLDSYELKKKIIAYLKYEGENLDSMTIVLKSIVNCEILGLEESFNGTCFGHAFSKTW